MEKIFRDVKMLIEVNCFVNVDNVTMESVFFDLGLDELDIVELIINVEDFYYIEISDDFVSTFRAEHSP
jgi:acyl carrier protein